VLDLFDMTTGGRVIFSVCKIGGVRKDINSEQAKRMDEVLAGMAEELKELTDVFLRDETVRSRLVGVGVLSAEDARNLGAVGPMARASGIDVDMRVTGYAAYSHVRFAVVTETAGDSFARLQVRIREVFQAISIIRQCLTIMPSDSTIDVPVKGFPNGEYFARLEQPRGQVLYYVKANGTKHLDRMRVRTPTFANVPALLHTLKGVDLADVPVLVLTIDPCISCTER
jgi:ech hydrogenase subunit E